MTGEDWRRVKTVLADALDLPAGERESWLEAELGDEPELLAEVRSLLAAHDAGGSLLEPATIPPETPAEVGTLPPGTRVGAYRIVREIGRGGMGIVFLAERDDESFERRVALKLIQSGGVGADVEDRFLRERRILARLDHPGIARLLDGGTTPDGRPYLIMEHVEGRPIDDHCRERQLDIEGRVSLFLEICSAVDFAHRNLVVHRDLKPSNVLVDGSGRPKLLDFGIATLLEEEVAGEGQAPTRTGLRAMTPEYASPEQIRGEAITIATDVYALGVVLYELLAGRRPYELGRLGLSEVVEVVCEQDPKPPSSAAENEELARRLRGDLDAVVMKALRKEPAERYRSAEELASDLRRYRDGLPVEARRGTFAYRTGKLVRRHRVAVAAASAFLMLLVSFAIVMAVQVARTGRALDLAEEEAAKVQAVQRFLEETLGAADPTRADGRQATIQEALDAARTRLDTTFTEQPEIEAAVQHLIGKLYSNLGSYDDAEPLLRQALATRRRISPSAEQAETLESLGLLLGRTGRPGEAEPLLEEALAIRQELGGGGLELANTLDLLAHVANAEGDPGRAAELERQALDAYRESLGERTPSVAHALATIAGFERARGELDAAEEALGQALDIVDSLPQVPLATQGELQSDLGELLEAQGRYEEAEQAYRQALDLYLRVYGEEHHWVAQGLVRLGVVQTRLERYDEAEGNLRRGVAITQRVLDPDHPDVSTSLQNLGFLLAERGDLDEAKVTLESALAIERRSIPGHPRIGVTLRNLGQVELRRSSPAEARPHLEEALDISLRNHGEDHPRTALSRLALGWAKRELGDVAGGVELQRSALATLEKTYDEDHPRVAGARAMLGESLAVMGAHDEAERLLRDALVVLQRDHGPDHHRVRRARESLAEITAEPGKDDPAR